jgi:hypothetical protein
MTSVAERFVRRLPAPAQRHGRLARRDRECVALVIEYHNRHLDYDWTIFT